MQKVETLLDIESGILDRCEIAWNTSRSFAGLLISLAQKQCTIPARILSSCSAVLSFNRVV